MITATNGGEERIGFCSVCYSSAAAPDLPSGPPQNSNNFSLLPFWLPKRKRKIFLKFLAVSFTAGRRRALLLSSPKEVSKKGATGKLDERQPTGFSFLFGHPKRKRKIFLKFLAVFFYGVPPWALLLSSLKEVSKKGATVSTRWTGRRKSKAPLKIAFSAM